MYACRTSTARLSNKPATVASAPDPFRPRSEISVAQIKNPGGTKPAMLMAKSVTYQRVGANSRQAGVRNGGYRMEYQPEMASAFFGSALSIAVPERKAR